MKKQALILLVADQENAARPVRRILAAAGVPTLNQFVKGRRAALSYLVGEGPYANREKHPLPGLVLLDLHAPGKDGFEMLTWIRSQPELKTLPVVVLTPLPLSSDPAGLLGIVGCVRSCLAAATVGQEAPSGKLGSASSKYQRGLSI